MSLEVLCRACLRQAAELTPLYGSSRLAPLLAACSGLQIAEDDGLPSSICKPCTRQAIEASSFKHQCEVSDAKLRNYITGAYQFSSLMEIKEELNPVIIRENTDLPVIGSSQISVIHQNMTRSIEDKFPIYDCSICGHNSASTKELIDHVLHTHASVKNENQCVCEICNTFLPSDFQLKKHQISHKELTVDGKFNTCPICREEFQRHGLLVRHMEYHLEESLHECPECNCFFTKSMHLNNHIKWHKNCNYTSDNDFSNDFDEMAVKIEPENYSQDSIVKSEAKYPEAFNNILELDNDDLIVNITNTQLKAEFVEPMSSTFNENNSDFGDRDDYSEYSSKKRKAVKKKKKSKTFKAKTEKDPKTKISIEVKLLPGLSIEQKKKTERSFLCSMCGKGYHKQTSLDKHIESHKNEGQQKPSHICTICGKVMSHSNHLLVHMRTHRDQNGQPIAKIKENPNKKVILCSMCGKSCSSRSNLAVHMRRHLGVMTCVCKICGKGYPRTTDLTLHMRQHTGERPFVCTQCHKSFARSDKLAIHMRIHTGEKPYRCKICNRGFAQSNDLAAHKKRNNCSQNPVLPPANSQDSNLTDVDVKPKNYFDLPSVPIDASKSNKIIETNKIKRNPNVQRLSAADTANGDSVDEDQLMMTAHTKALELAAAAVTNNIFFMSGNNSNNRVLDFLNGDPLAARSLVKQNLMMPDLVATQRVLEFATANHNNMLAAHQRSDFSDYATGSLLQNLSNAQSAQYDMR